MANLTVLVLMFAMTWYLASIIRRRSQTLVAKRGTSVGQDLGTLASKPRARVLVLARVGGETARVVLTHEPNPHLIELDSEPDLDLLVYLREDESGWDILREWHETGTVVAVVIPPDSPLVRLRSIDGLQPLTLRRVYDD